MVNNINLDLKITGINAISIHKHRDTTNTQRIKNSLYSYVESAFGDVLPFTVRSIGLSKDRPTNTGTGDGTGSISLHESGHLNAAVLV